MSVRAGEAAEQAGTPVGQPRRGVPRLLWTALAALAGAGIGAAYAHFVGCRTGTCPLTSNVWIASLYGGGVGALIGLPSRRAVPGRTGPSGG
ncbi:DUF6132 family protein [Anaeromyxobacter oryzae]|uniref:YtxH domain-containing protein n=1 Tax=Anaeromyxobacter oryzae TaxID=2918170 RepID=A0ABM7WS29_9BACT|nr:DUF6132 family protein [Anaeromyxobacter oryzae]BDG02251.1 hypothetical protein AMOR_12470 [Anaeromyxobacter oryzae]